ncbi:MAG: OmpA family protein [Campylobacteraceae bacterium]|jgi:OOP family OmpA-OmpF porin|nr:OmpA family protein [Campylobacteraceae bacterium]
MRKAVFITIALGCVLMAAGAKYEITPTVGGVFPEGDTNLKNQLSAGLRFGQYLDNRFFSKIEGGVELTSTHYKNLEANASKQQALLARYFLHGIREFEVAKDTHFYALIGAGYENIRKKARYGNGDSLYANYGFGVRYEVTNNLYLRAELRHAIKFQNGNGDDNLFATLGISYALGVKPKAQIAPVVEPAAKEEASVQPAAETQTAAATVETEPEAAKEAEVTKEPEAAEELDSDNDGVLDSSDLCPNTPAEFSVDSVGCIKPITLKINFAFGKFGVSEEFKSEIASIAKILNNETDYDVIIEGHTDSLGHKEFNLKLSEKRAESVAQELINLGIDADRITTEGFGDEKPIATNESAEGRAENRRIEAIFIK